jgi:hypothetical protein
MINTYKPKADHIKQGGSLALSDEQIANIPIEKVYEWVRTGQWRQKHFIKWLKVLRVVE